MRLRYGTFRRDTIGYLPTDPTDPHGVRGWFVLPGRCDRWAGPYPTPEAALNALEALP